MNLDLAQEYLEESSQNFSVMRDRLNETKIDALMFKALKNAMEGDRFGPGQRDWSIRIRGRQTRSTI